MTANTPQQASSIGAPPLRHVGWVGPRSYSPEPAVLSALERTQREARRDLAVAAGNARALMHAEALQARRLLALGAQLGERRYERLACGISGLDANLEAARAAAQQARPSGVRAG